MVLSDYLQHFCGVNSKRVRNKIKLLIPATGSDLGQVKFYIETMHVNI